MRRLLRRPVLPQRRRNRVLLAVTAAVAAALVAVGVLWFTPAMSVRTVEVTGLDRLTEPEVVSALAVPAGTPLMQVDTSAAAHRVAGIARVARVSVHREFPSTIRVDVTERVPVAFRDTGDGPHLLDRSGIDFAAEPPPPGLPKITMADHGDAELLRSVLQVVGGLPPELRGQITSIDVGSPSDISFGLADGRTLVWGSVERSGLKAPVALAVLQQPGQTVDVSSPNLPTTK
ncbi:cell division protein FtsQ/DivIB [Tomitella gaofuii]|uniref:cell division protein FtsQ/DivIB n=1 Tax=Tomitella gaofuii TaxID=2760083 RepID=UPI0015F9124D|nr:FtsQ-type POTRA domain-containing protein [Tomitella gaofuii]